MGAVATAVGVVSAPLVAGGAAICATIGAGVLAYSRLKR